MGRTGAVKGTFILVTILTISLMGCGQYPRQIPASEGSRMVYEEHGNLKTEIKLGRYTYRSFIRYLPKKVYEETFQILKDGSLVYSESMEIFPGYFGTQNVFSVVPPVGKDMTGDGMPDLVVEAFSGGAHCCFSYLIFSLGEQFEKIAEIEGWYSLFEFKDMDGDGIYELIGDDWTFAYWQTSFASSPSPEIILRYKDGRYIMADDLMRKRPPEHGEFEAELLQVGREFSEIVETGRQEGIPWARNGEVPPGLWRYMLDLIYTGNGQLAFDFFDKAWPNRKKGKNEFLEAFKEELSGSPYWPEIKKMNNW